MLTSRQDRYLLCLGSVFGCSESYSATLDWAQHRDSDVYSLQWGCVLCVLPRAGAGGRQSRSHWTTQRGGDQSL